MIIHLFILGILMRRGSAHGYRIYSDIKEWHVETWTVIRPGSIYHALGQMEKRGLIAQAAHVDAPKLGPSKTEYSVTSRGAQEFMTLLESALSHSNLIELSVGIAFMEYLPRQRVVALLQKRAEAQRQISDQITALPTEAMPTTPAKHPELIRVWADSYAAAAGSTEKLIHAIQSGRYVFKNEEV